MVEIELEMIIELITFFSIMPVLYYLYKLYVAKTGKEFKGKFLFMGFVLALLAIVELVEFHYELGVVLVEPTTLNVMRDIAITVLLIYTASFLRWFYGKYIGPVERIKR